MSAPVRLYGKGAAAGLWLYGGLVLLFLYAPILIVMVLSVNDSASVGLPIKGLTTKWFVMILSSTALQRATVNSLLLGAASAAIGTALALLLALAFRRDFPFKNAVFQLVLLPIIVPSAVLGSALLVLFDRVGLPLQLWTSVLAVHVTVVLPFAFLSLYPRLHDFDRGLEEAARDLGATPAQVMRKIVLPIIRPGILAAGLFAFSLSFDEVVRTLFLSGFDRTLPVLFWDMVAEKVSPEAPAVAVIIIVLSVVASLLGYAVAGRSGHGTQAAGRTP